MRRRERGSKKEFQKKRKRMSKRKRKIKRERKKRRKKERKRERRGRECNDAVSENKILLLTTENSVAHVVAHYLKEVKRVVKFVIASSATNHLVKVSLKCYLLSLETVNLIELALQRKFNVLTWRKNEL